MAVPTVIYVEAKMFIPMKSSFTIKARCKGVLITQTCYPDELASYLEREPTDVDD